MESPIALNPVQEEFLAAVLLLQENNLTVTMATLAGHLQVHVSFAEAAVKGLIKMGLLELTTCNSVGLTLEARIRARDIERRRTAVADVLCLVFHLDPLTAEQAARCVRKALSRSDVNRIMCARCWRHQKSLRALADTSDTGQSAVVSSGSP